MQKGKMVKNFLEIVEWHVFENKIRKLEWHVFGNGGSIRHARKYRKVIIRSHVTIHRMMVR